MAQGAWDNGWDEAQTQTLGFFGVRPHDVPDSAYSDDPTDTPNGNWVVDDMPRIWDPAKDDPDYVAPGG